MDSKSYDAVVVLNGGAKESGELYEDTKSRVSKALQLATRSSIANVIMVGHEAADMRRFAEQIDDGQRQQPFDILVEDHSHNTIENAHFVKTKFLVPRHWRSIVVVTELFHLERTRLSFEMVLGDDYQIDFVASEAPYTAEQRRQLAEQEAYFINMTKTKLAGIGPDDDAAREEMLESKREVTTQHFPAIRV